MPGRKAITGDAEKRRGALEQRRKIEQEIIKNQEEETMNRSRDIPRPRASVAHMQWGGCAEETKEESRNLYNCSGAAGFKNTTQVNMTQCSVVCGPHLWRVPDRDAWEVEFVKNIPKESLGAWHVKDEVSEDLVLTLLYEYAPPP